MQIKAKDAKTNRADSAVGSGPTLAAMPPPDSEPVKIDRERRVQRLCEYGDQVLRTASPLLASLGAVEVDLMVMCIYFRDDVDEIRRTTSDPRERARILVPMSEQYFKLTKQLNAAINLRNSLEKTSTKFLGPLERARDCRPDSQRWPPIQGKEPTDSLSRAPQSNPAKVPGAGGTTESDS